MDTSSEEWRIAQTEAMRAGNYLVARCHPFVPAIQVSMASDKFVCGFYDKAKRDYCGAFVRWLKPYEKSRKLMETESPVIEKRAEMAPDTGYPRSWGSAPEKKAAPVTAKPPVDKYKDAFMPAPESWDADQEGL